MILNITFIISGISFILLFVNFICYIFGKKYADEDWVIFGCLLLIPIVNIILLTINVLYILIRYIIKYSKIMRIYSLNKGHK